jgi:hypothetical protein
MLSLLPTASVLVDHSVDICIENLKCNFQVVMNSDSANSVCIKKNYLLPISTKRSFLEKWSGQKMFASYFTKQWLDKNRSWFDLHSQHFRKME